MGARRAITPRTLRQPIAGQTMDGWEVVSGDVGGNHNDHGPVAIPVAGYLNDLDGNRND